MAVATETAGWPNRKDDYELQDVIGKAIMLFIDVEVKKLCITVVNKTAHG